MQIIDQQADQLRYLIRDLLDLTRIESGTLSVVPQPVHATDLVSDANNIFARSTSQNRIVTRLASNLPLIMADKLRIGQVLNNLLSNASKFSPEGSVITVDASFNDMYVSFSINDEGNGIPTSQLSHLFKKFSRLGEDAGARKPGHGLGLAICKGIVEAHGGRIWATKGENEHGTRITFTIPVAEEHNNEIGKSPARTIPNIEVRSTKGEGGRVLVVDDDAQALRHIRNILSEANFSPILVDRVENIDRLIQIEQPHIAVVDLILPGTDGFQLINLIREISDIPIIMISATSDEASIVRALEMGADDYIVKPFSQSELVARIGASMRKRANTNHLSYQESYSLEGLTIEYTERSVTMYGILISLTATEYKLLFELSINGGRVLTQQQLLQRIWGQEYIDEGQLVRAFVKKLRRKLNDDASNPKYIFTEQGVGYRMPKPRPGLSAR